MKKVLTTISKVFIFGLIFLGLFAVANVFFRPVWLSEDSIGEGEGSPAELEEVGEVAAYEATNEDATAGFYAEPENKIQTLFVGASMTSVGVTPMELYEKYGICAYSLTSEAQPVLASYFWVKEAKRLHPDSLKTVIFDVSMMRRDVGKGFYEKALNGMKYSSVKREAIKEASNGVGAMLGYTFPLLTYHSRWAELKRTDFVKFGYEPRSYLRGYNMRTIRLFDEGTYEDMPLSTSVLNENVEERVELHEKSEKYLRKMVDFCNENGIRLILYKTPAVGNWGNKEHFTIQALADELGVDYLDFVFEPLVDEIGYNPATDSENRKHNNYYGAAKLTDWFGKYLTEQCNVQDVRGNSDYSYMDTQLEEYKQKVEKVVALKAAASVGQYISYLTIGNGASSNDDKSLIRSLPVGGSFTTMITVKGHAGRMLSDEDRATLKKCGLTVLSEIDDKESYIGIIENGSVKYEGSCRDDGTIKGNVHRNHNKTIDYTGRFPKGEKYTLISGSRKQGDVSSCMISETEYSLNMEGINIVVYDNDADTIADDTYFNTWDYADRESYDTETALKEALADGLEFSDLSEGLKKLYLYDKRVEYYREARHLMLEIRNAEEEEMSDSGEAAESDDSGLKEEDEESDEKNDTGNSDVTEEDSEAGEESDNTDNSLNEEESDYFSHRGVWRYIGYYMSGDRYNSVKDDSEDTDKNDLVIYISVNGDASIALGEEDRAQLKKLGLDNLSQLEAGEGYIGIIDCGEVICDVSQSKGNDDSTTRADGSMEISNLGYDIISCGNNYIDPAGISDNGLSEIIINQKDYSPNGYGINVVIYDKNIQMIADTECF